uniref:Uncharacterized protein n=1 Tax=Tetraselmis sp. GSL018 TaxID=582737 RepID=A0A061SB56_9CHLO
MSRNLGSAINLDECNLMVCSVSWLSSTPHTAEGFALWATVPRFVTRNTRELQFRYWNCLSLILRDVVLCPLCPTMGQDYDTKANEPSFSDKSQVLLSGVSYSRFYFTNGWRLISQARVGLLLCSLERLSTSLHRSANGL